MVVAEQAAKLAEREAQLGQARELVTQLRDSRSRLVAEHATETAGLKHQVVNLSDSHSALKKATVVLKMELMDAKTVTINRLLDICPQGTIDPTPFLYDDALMVLGTCAAGALITNAMLVPMDKSKHETFGDLDLDASKRLQPSELGVEVLKAMDANYDGVVAKKEFDSVKK